VRDDEIVFPVLAEQFEDLAGRKVAVLEAIGIGDRMKEVRRRFGAENGEADALDPVSVCRRQGFEFFREVVLDAPSIRREMKHPQALSAVDQLEKVPIACSFADVDGVRRLGRQNEKHESEETESSAHEIHWILMMRLAMRQ